jgi:hypothetical protein
MEFVDSTQLESYPIDRNHDAYCCRRPEFSKVFNLVPPVLGALPVFRDAQPWDVTRARIALGLAAVLGCERGPLCKR